MNKSEIEMEQKEVSGERRNLALIATPIMIISGLTMDRKFNDSELLIDVLPFLTNDTYVNIILIFGFVVFPLWGGYKTMLIARKERELHAKQNT